MNKNTEKSDSVTADPWGEATDAYFAAANLYAETMQAFWMAGTEAVIESMQSGFTTSSETGPAEVGAKPDTSAASKPATSWYRPPVENAFLSMVDDAMKPWRTMIPDHSRHAQHLTEADIFTPRGAAEILAAYQTGSGFSMAQVTFPDEKSVCVTMPAPWAMLTK